MLIISMMPGSRAAVDEMLNRLETFGERLAPKIIGTGFDLARQVILETFQGEGHSGVVGGAPWSPLAPRTQRERAWLGFDPHHPILFRTGTLLESLVDENSSEHVVVRAQMGPGRWVGRLGTTDDRFEELQQGVPGRNLPARPMWPIGDAETRFVGLLNERVMKVIGENF